MRDELPQGTVTLLLTDIEGSTRLLHQLGAEGYADAQAEHRDLLRAAFHRHGGVEVDTQGDAFFYVFPEAAGCLRGAVEAQRALAHHPWAHGEPVKVRMGANTGTPQRTDEGYVGVPVNTAARIASAGHGGQVLLSERTAELLTEALENDEITLREMGRHRLKDLDQPIRLYQIVIPELPSDFPPPRTAETRPNNLPTPLTAFVGRAQIVAKIRDLLLRTDVRAVTLIGPGGTGKTRLGLRVAGEVLHSMEDGAFFAGLAALRDPSLVASEIASALGVKEEAGKTLLEAVCDHLVEKELLLLLDNFEQVQEAARDVATILSRCPGVKVLTTSRQPLRISGERGFPVPPLELPDADANLTPEELGDNEAVRLFVERAQSVNYEFELAESNASQVLEICRRVDALPLAIELSAAKLWEMDVAQLLQSLDRRLAVLNEGSVDLLDHQRTLRDLVAWSYDLLDEHLQASWRRLAVFAGGCTAETAEMVCNLEGGDTLESDLEELVSRSLLTPDFRGSSGAEKVILGQDERRYTMLETLREYAADVLSSAPEAAEVTERFENWSLALAEEAESHLRGPDLQLWLDRLNAEIANFRAALDIASNPEVPHPDQALRLSAALHFYFYSTGYLSEGRERLLAALEFGEQAAPQSRAKALYAAAALNRQQNRIDEAETYAGECLEIYRSLGDEDGVASVLSMLGGIAQRREDYDAAAKLLQEAAELQEKTGNQERLGVTYNLLGITEQMRDRIEAAGEYYARSLATAQAVADQNTIGTALINLGEVTQIAGDLGGAADYYRDALRIWADIHQGLFIAYCMEVLAGIDVAGGRPREAALLFGTADRIREELGAPVEPFNQERYQRDLDTTRGAMTEDDFTQAWEEGRRMRTEEAIELAMVDNESTAA
jgi:predicted ATPase/class 3 adenylate cyclase